MKQTKQFLRPLLMAIVMLVGMLVPQGAWAITFFTEEGDDVWCEDNIAVALEELTRLRETYGYHVTTMRFDKNIALSEEFELARLGQDITIDLNDCVLTNEPYAADWMSCIVYYIGCDYRITIQNGTIESNELDAICFHGMNPDPYYQLILRNVNVVTHREGRHCLFDVYPGIWEDWWNEDSERAPKLQIIDSQFHSNGCSAISFTHQRNDELVKSILPDGYSFYNDNTDVELVEYADRPFVDENGNPATDIRTGFSQYLPKIKITYPNGYEVSCGYFKQAMDDGFGEITLTLLDNVKEGLCTTNDYKSVTIDLNGHTLDITHLSTNHGNNLNIIDSSEGKTGKLIVERFDVYTPAENNAVIEGEVITWVNNRFTNNGLVEYVDGSFINNGDFITSWTWADDHSSATLRINHEDVDAVVTNEDTTPATCIASGVRTYTAAATYRDRNYADTKDEEIAIDPNAHDYQVLLDEDNNPVFVWSEGYTTATLQVVCSHNAEHTANVEVTGEDITSEDTTPATCTTAGVRTYTAKATYKDVEYTGTKEVEIPAAGHSFVDGVCEVCHATAVAEVKIGETTTGYTDIQEAFDAAMAATGEVTVKLLADVTLTEFENNLDRGEEANRYDVALTLDLNGHNVTGKNSQADIPVTSITLNITDSSEGMTGSINNCLLLVAKSYIYVDEGVTLRAEEWDLVFLQGDCYLENHGNLYGIVVYNAGTTFINCGSVVRAQYFGGDFENWGSFIPIWYWVYNDVDEVMSSVSVSVNGTIYSSDEGTLEVSSEVTQAPTCTEKGERTYSATVTYEYKDYSDTYTAEIGIDPNAHDFTSKTLTAEPDEHGLYAYACDREGCEGHSDYNVVKGNGEGNNIELIATTDSETGITTYSAESVIIEDGKPFYSPVEFTTRDVDMGRQFTQSIGDAVVPATIMLPFRMEAGEVSTVNPQGVRTGTKFYSFTSLDYNSANDRWEANMDIVIDDLEAYTPYMVVLTDGEEIPFGNAPVTFTQTPAEMNNISSSDGEWSFVATNEAKVWTAADFGHGEAYYGFAAGNETTPEGKFVKVGTGASIDPLRAYIMKNVQTRGSASNAPSRALTASQLPSTIGVRLNETYATGIGTLNTETGEFTFDGWYDLQGRRISEPVKNGISIKNDKKILVK